MKKNPQPANPAADSTADSTANPAANPAEDKPRAKGKGSRSQARRFARERALQALYQHDLGGDSVSDVRSQFLERQDMSRVDTDYFLRLFNGIALDVDAVDVAMTEALDRPLNDLDPIERGVLRIATYELQICLDTPARVVINEGVEITKRFGAEQGHKYVNGVLDKLAINLRAAEMGRR